MDKQNPALRVYLIFFIAFLTMHFTGVLVAGLPYILNAVITMSVVLLITMGLSRWLMGESFATSLFRGGIRLTGWKHLIPGVIVSAVLLLAYLVLGFFLNTKLVLTTHWFLNLTGLSLTAGIMEEFVFRGFLFGYLRQGKSFLQAALISMLCFSLAHLLLFTYIAWPIALLSTVLAAGSSIPLAYLFEKGGNTIWSAAIVHTTIRTIGLVVTTDDQNYSNLASGWIMACLVLPYLVLLFYKDFRQLSAKSKPIKHS